MPNKNVRDVRSAASPETDAGPNLLQQRQRLIEDLALLVVRYCRWRRTDADAPATNERRLQESASTPGGAG
jgi:hypothetical protein